MQPIASVESNSFLRGGSSRARWYCEVERSPNHSDERLSVRLRDGYLDIRCDKAFSPRITGGVSFLPELTLEASMRPRRFTADHRTPRARSIERTYGFNEARPSVIAADRV